MMLLEAVKYAFKIMQTGALGDLTEKIVEPLPTWSDDQLRDYIRSMVKSALHPIGEYRCPSFCAVRSNSERTDVSDGYVGTASMLPRSANGVVDDELKVRLTAVGDIGMETHVV